MYRARLLSACAVLFATPCCNVSAPDHPGQLKPMMVYPRFPIEDAEAPPSIVALIKDRDGERSCPRRPLQWSSSLAETGFSQCPDSPLAKYQHQPLNAECAGVLVAENVVATAKHCITDCNNGGHPGCQPGAQLDERFLFDYTQSEVERRRTGPDPEKVYGGSICEVGEKFDWVLVRLDRSAPEHRVFRGGFSKPRKNQRLHSRQFPLGLPMKSADLEICDDCPEADDGYIADMTMFSKSSGAVVFAPDGSLVGLLKGSQSSVDPFHHSPEHGCHCPTVCELECQDDPSTQVASMMCGSSPIGKDCSKSYIVPSVEFHAAIEACNAPLARSED